MTVQTEEKMVKGYEIKSITCDVCKKVVDYTGGMGIEEFIFISHQAGYDSIFGDGNHIYCDICQDCLKKLLEQYLRIEEISSFPNKK